MDAQLASNVPQAQTSFWTHMWNLVLVHLETVLVSVRDRCMVYAKRTIGSKIILDTPTMVLLGDGTQV
jgi:hypothetical protein